MADTSKIREHMEIVGSNDQHFAIVDEVKDNAIKVTKDERGQHHYIPLSWVDRVDQQVHLNMSGDQAMRDWTTNPPMGG